jgi:methyltransferase (TIGR00027 family)
MIVGPENTAVRVALWRALHVEIDPPPHVFHDVVGLELVAPEPGWQQRPDMSAFTSPFRASIVGRARFVEDLVEAAVDADQYVLLGAGLDTFAQRRPVRVQVFEIDQPGPQTWKRDRLIALGYGVPSHLHFVPVDFEAGEDWRDRLVAAGFDERRPAIVASTGVSMYLSRESIEATVRTVSTFTSGSMLAMTFMLPIEMADPAVRPGIEAAARGARAAGTPFVSFFTPAEMLGLARKAGFQDVQHVSADEISLRYFSNRSDGLRPPSNSEEFLIATT